MGANRETAQKIITDPAFDPSMFIGDMILDWVQENCGEIIKKSPTMLTHMLPDEHTWGCVVAQLCEETLPFLNPLIPQWVERIAGCDNEYIATDIADRLASKLLAFENPEQYSASLMTLLPLTRGDNFKKIQKMGIPFSLGYALQVVSKISMTLCKDFCKLADLSILRNSTFRGVISKRFELVCPRCEYPKKSRPGYTLHIRMPERRDRGHRIDNKCFNAESVFDIVRGRLGYNTSKRQGWF